TLGTVVTGQHLDAIVDHHTRLVDLRGGRGVQPGIIRLSTGGNFAEVDLSRSGSLGDVLDVLDGFRLDGRELTAEINNGNVEIDFADGQGGALLIQDARGGVLAQQLGIQNDDGLRNPPIVAGDLDPRVTTGTRIDQLDRFIQFGGANLNDGFRIHRGQETIVIDTSNAETVGDIIVAINRSDAGVRAEIDPHDGRILLRATLSGVDYAVSENGGSVAEALGIRTATEETRLSSLGRGQGITFNSTGDDVEITRPDGVALRFDLSETGTVGDFIDAIRNHPDNQDSRRIIPSLNAIDNGIQLIAPPLGDRTIRVRQIGTGNAAERLGLVAHGESEAEGTRLGAVQQFTGIDFDLRESGGAIDTLLRLQQAIESGDIREIGRLQGRLDEDLQRATNTRGRIGVWTQNLERTQDSVQRQTIALQEELSGEIDTDFAQVVADLNNQQSALEASLRFIGQSANLTLLNYL
ncbi:MAG: flagellin hook IN motif-containing protein, partial [Planctomycetota bacterium]